MSNRVNARSTHDEAHEQGEHIRGLSPTAARRRLGAVLRETRERAGLTLEEAGRPLQRSAATISRLENGKVKPRLLEIGFLLDLYAKRRPEAVDESIRERAEALAEEGRREAWFSPYRDVLTGSMVTEHAGRLLELETDATQMLSFQPDLIPGLLQTSGYARAIADTYYPDTSSHERERFVEFRMQRKRVLTRHESPLALHVIMGEQALRRSVGGAAVMREQLSTLIDMIHSGVPNVTIQIAPVTLAVRGAIGGPFVVLSFSDAADGDLVYLEGRSGAEYLQSEADLRQYRALFDDLAAAALDPQASSAMLTDVIRTLTP